MRSMAIPETSYPSFGRLASPIWFPRGQNLATCCSASPRMQLHSSGGRKPQRPEAAGRGNVPLLHYLARGAAEGLDPNPDFSSADHFRRYPDAQASGLTALEHFMLLGAREGRDPRHEPTSQPKSSGNLRLVCVFSHFDAAGRILRARKSLSAGRLDGASQKFGQVEGMSGSPPSWTGSLSVLITSILGITPLQPSPLNSDNVCSYTVRIPSSSQNILSRHSR